MKIQTLKKYVGENFDSNSASSAKKCVRISTGKAWSQGVMYQTMQDENYLVIDINGTPTVVKKMAEFQ